MLEGGWSIKKSSRGHARKSMSVRHHPSGHYASPLDNIIEPSAEGPHQPFFTSEHHLPIPDGIGSSRPWELPDEPGSFYPGADYYSHMSSKYQELPPLSQHHRSQQLLPSSPGLDDVLSSINTPFYTSLSSHSPSSLVSGQRHSVQHSSVPYASSRSQSPWPASDEQELYKSRSATPEWLQSSYSPMSHRQTTQSTGAWPSKKMRGGCR